MTTIECIRLVGTEFSDVSNADLNKWITFCEPYVSKKKFGKLYERALALMVCHKMKIHLTEQEANGSASTNSSLGSIDDMLRVGSYSEGGVSISFGVSGQGLSDKNGDLPLTLYGIEYLRLMKQRITPIVVRGEGNYIDISKYYGSII